MLLPLALFSFCLVPALALPEACLKPPETGRCRGYFVRYHYDAASKSCKKFVYGGCEGNENNFRTLDDCRHRCGAEERAELGDVCNLPEDSGLCDAYIPRFRFDRESGTCKLFVYGGCGGNLNNFKTFDDCEKACREEVSDSHLPPICKRPAHPGRCSAHFPRYYYDYKSGSCKRFFYGGCGDNGNNFPTEAACLKACVYSIPHPAPSINGVCKLPQDGGFCEDFQPRFYFDPKDGYCKVFVYSGCGGNFNNFNNYDECMTTCGEEKKKAPVADEELPLCHRPAKTGLCKAYFPRYFYDKNSGTCRKFVYGGCQSNGNNFETEQECLQTCQEEKKKAPVADEELPLCHRPAKTGLCKAYFPRYFYDKNSGTCRKFVYGGCQSNGNNFETEQECLQTCQGQ